MLAASSCNLLKTETITGKVSQQFSHQVSSHHGTLLCIVIEATTTGARKYDQPRKNELVLTCSV